MVTKRELEELKELNRILFQISETGNSDKPKANEILIQRGLIKPVYKNKKKKGFQTGSTTIRTFVKFNLTDKGKQYFKIMNALI